MLGVEEDYNMFQFEVDNAASIERSVAILLTALPERPQWIRHYLSITLNENIYFAFFYQFIRHIASTAPTPTPTHITQLRVFLKAAKRVPDRWLLKAACDTRQPSILASLLEVPGVEEHVDDWICLYVAEYPTLSRLLLDKKQGNLTVPL